MTASSPETVRSLWDKFFPDVPLTNTSWLERHVESLLIQGLQAAVKHEEEGKPWKVRDEHNIGRYVNKACQRIQNKNVVTKTVNGDFVIKVPVRMRGGYQITEKDRGRFQEKVQRRGDHLIWIAPRTEAAMAAFTATVALKEPIYLASSMRMAECYRQKES